MFPGSFKIRGASYQFSQFPEIKTQKLVTISAGNYGTAFATLAKEIGVAKNAMVIMPNTVPERRKTRIEVINYYLLAMASYVASVVNDGN